MSDLETLTDDERVCLQFDAGVNAEKALRIIDAQAAALAEARAEAQAERDSAKEFARQLREARAESTEERAERAERAEQVDARFVAEAQLATANGLLERASVRLDETNYPEWWKAYRVHLSGQPAAPDPRDAEIVQLSERIGIEVQTRADRVTAKEAEVARLTSERAERDAEIALFAEERRDANGRYGNELAARLRAESEVARLTKALAAAEQGWNAAKRETAQWRARAEAAEQKLAEAERVRLEHARRSLEAQAARDAAEARCGELETQRKYLSHLSKVVGQALVIPTLAPGETLSEPSDHAIVQEMLRYHTKLAQLRERVAKVLRKADTFADGQLDANEVGRLLRDQ